MELIIAVFLAASIGLAAAGPEGAELKRLVDKFLPGCQVQYDSEGKPKAVSSPDGEFLDLKGGLMGAGRLLPTGPLYQSSLAMEFFRRQNVKARSEDEAVSLIKILDELGWGKSKMKEYAARRFDGGWVILSTGELIGDVGRGITNYPSVWLVIPPYELLVDAKQNVIRFQYRSYAYPGSASVYSNTVVSVNRTVAMIPNLLYHHMVMRDELRKAWEKEKEQTGNEEDRKGLQQALPADAAKPHR